MKKLLSVLLAISLIMSLGMFASATIGDSYDMDADFSWETATPTVWEYVHTADGGSSFDVMTVVGNMDWGDFWYLETAGEGTGLGVNPDDATAAYYELNNNNADGVDTSTGIAFVAPNAGSFKVSAITVMNLWEQDAEKFYVSKGSSVVASVAMDGETTTIPEMTVTLEEGEKLYFFAKSAGGWLSAYLSNIVVEEVEEPAEEPTPVVDETEPGDALPIAMVVISAITAGGALIARKRR